MTNAKVNRYLRKAHLWFGIGIGLQLGLWLISGLFMTLFPIDQVRGTHLRSQRAVQTISPNIDVLGPAEIIAKHSLSPQSLTLKLINNKPFYIALDEDKTQLINAVTGAIGEPLDEKLATQIAVTNYAGRSSQTVALFFEEKAPREYGRKGPVWRIDFKKPDAASFYVDATTADVKAVRTGLWRTFDFMWGLHIMDWSNRENFNSWWLKTVAALSVVFFLTGFALVMQRLISASKRRRQSRTQA